MKTLAIWRLMRLDKPVGTLLLWFPTAWALWIANDKMPSAKLVFLFFMGTLFMRSAGCVINDIADRHIDKHVQRTNKRPLAQGELSLTDAAITLLLLLLAACVVLVQLPASCVLWAVAGLGITVIYPFCKRFLSAPQVVLGLAFSFGIPMAFIASDESWTQEAIILFLINFLWIVAYDTMYAMADRDDDLKIGVKSTAIFFGVYERLAVGIMQLILHGLWLYLGYLINAPIFFYLVWILGAGVLIYQQKLLKNRDVHQCFNAFRFSVYYGALMWVAVIL